MPAASGSRPSSASTSVVLPLPLGPTSATRSPHASSRSIGPSSKRPASHDGAVEARGDVAGALAAAEAQLQLPAPPRLVDLVEALDRLLGGADLGGLLLRALRARAADVLVRLVAGLGVAHAGLGPLALAARPVGQPVALGREGLVALLGVALGRRAQLEVAGPAAAVLRGRVGDLVDLEHARDRALEEGAVVGDDHGAARALGDEALQPLQAVEVEVVGRLVEQQDVEAREQDRRERGAGGLPAGERGRLQREQRRVEPEVAQHRLGARLEVGAAEREPALERVGVGVRGAGLLGRHRVGRLVHERVGGRDAGAAREVVVDALAGSAVGLLRQVAGGAGRQADRAPVGAVDAGEQAQQRRLPGPVGADHAEDVAGRDGRRDAGEHRRRPVRLVQLARDQRAGHAIEPTRRAVRTPRVRRAPWHMGARERLDASSRPREPPSRRAGSASPAACRRRRHVASHRARLRPAARAALGGADPARAGDVARAARVGVRRSGAPRRRRSRSRSACALCGGTRPAGADARPTTTGGRSPAGTTTSSAARAAGSCSATPASAPSGSGSSTPPGATPKFLGGKYKRKRHRAATRSRWRRSGRCSRPARAAGCSTSGAATASSSSSRTGAASTSYGVDLAEDAIAAARQRPGGAHTYHGAPSEIPEIAAGGFDVITMWSVLAHLAEPVEDLTMLRRLLAPDGVLLLLTVNAGSLKLKRQLETWDGFTPNHLIFFSPETAPAAAPARRVRRRRDAAVVRRAGRARQVTPQRSASNVASAARSTAAIAATCCAPPPSPTRTAPAGGGSRVRRSGS